MRLSNFRVPTAIAGLALLAGTSLVDMAQSSCRVLECTYRTFSVSGFVRDDR